jgi:hypothetical protein
MDSAKKIGIDNYTEDSSIYAHGDEYTNAVNMNSNRHELDLEAMEAISDDSDL